MQTVGTFDILYVHSGSALFPCDQIYVNGTSSAIRRRRRRPQPALKVTIHPDGREGGRKEGRKEEEQRERGEDV